MLCVGAWACGCGRSGGAPSPNRRPWPASRPGAGGAPGVTAGASDFCLFPRSLAQGFSLLLPVGWAHSARGLQVALDELWVGGIIFIREGPCRQGSGVGPKECHMDRQRQAVGVQEIRIGCLRPQQPRCIIPQLAPPRHSELACLASLACRLPALAGSGLGSVPRSVEPLPPCHALPEQAQHNTKRALHHHRNAWFQKP